MDNIFHTLSKRGFVKQTTNADEIQDFLASEPRRFYIGFDPTADSLHVGHLLQLIAIKHMQGAGHQPILLIGGGTAHVGDPSGRTDLRQMMTRETIDENGQQFAAHFARIVDMEKAIVSNNADWLLDLNYVDFLRDVGTKFSVNKMLSAECFKSRLEIGLSFLEFNYMLMQAYDFYVLSEKYDCLLQLGGDDQWSNILAGTDLIRRKSGRKAHGMTFTLLETKSGQKMGKTAGGAVWLDEEKTSPYEFFQYFRNVGDEDVENCLKLLTFIPLEDIDGLLGAGDINHAKEVLAFEVTKLVHGEEKAKAALEAAHSLFSKTGGGSAGDGFADVPQTIMAEENFSGGHGLAALMTAVKLTQSNSEAFRAIEQGGVSLNGEKTLDKRKMITLSDFEGGELLIKKGKKNFHMVRLDA
jgi:tyrosyl-tRNA synthetase